ncbi:MAG TPA: hypothetical protein VL096_03245, partial [Pirellulaceae bacterium]|nr:hypothetical protein [Pirellulaceae bacterium]
GHLASIIWDNVDSLRKKQRLSSASWDKTSLPHREVLAWLKSPAVMAYLESAQFDELQGEFIYAVPQLKMIQKALASESL